MERRSFLINSGLTLGALFIAPSFILGNKKRNIGLQLYTLKDIFTNKNVKNILGQIQKIGYKEIETYGFSDENSFFGVNVKDFKTILLDNGLKVCSGHYDFGLFLKNGNLDLLKNSINIAKILETKYITIPWIEESIRKTADDYKKIAEKINKAAIFYKEFGFKLAYHNHDFEFKNLGNITGYEILLQETDKNLVDFELDLYWVVHSGNDPLKLVEGNSNRFKMLHIKDMSKLNHELNTEIGNGMINFKSIFKSTKFLETEYFFVEQETNYNLNQIESIKKSYNYLKKII